MVTVVTIPNKRGTDIDAQSTQTTAPGLGLAFKTFSLALSDPGIRWHSVNRV